MNTAVRVVLAVAAAAGTLLIGRTAYSRERNQAMSLPVTVTVGVLLLVVYGAVFLSV